VLDAPTIAAIARTAVEEYREQEAESVARAERMEQASTIAKTLRGRALARLRSKIES